eukprot:g8495.t1
MTPSLEFHHGGSDEAPELALSPVHLKDMTMNSSIMSSYSSCARSCQPHGIFREASLELGPGGGLPLLRCPPEFQEPHRFKGPGDIFAGHLLWCGQPRRMCGPAVVEQGMGPKDLPPDPTECKHNDEDELIREVPFLLERMNDAATELNRLEGELTRAEGSYKIALDTWRALYDELRWRHGRASGAVDHAKPYFDTLRRCQAATRHAKESQRRWRELRQRLKALEQTEGLAARATPRTASVLSALQREVRSSEEEFQMASKALGVIREELLAQREKVGTATIEEARPCFSSLKTIQLDLVTAQEDVARLTQGIRSAKADYKDSLSKLNRISDEVHACRKSFS